MGVALAGLWLAAPLAFAAPSPDLSSPSASVKVNVEANKIAYDGNSKIAVATGTVVIVYGQYVLTATRVTYDTVRDHFTANGSVVLKESSGYELAAPKLLYNRKTDTALTPDGIVLTDPDGNVLEAASAELRNKFKDGFASHLRLLLASDATVTADYAVRSEGNITVFEHATYTACKGCVTRSGKPLWQIVSSQVTHDQAEKTLYHKNARLEIGGVPVFWTPYLSHPDPSVKRRSGLLIPKVSATKAYGLGVEIPYFINLAPNYDLTLSPVLTTKQGVIGKAEWRHRVADGTYAVKGAGLYQLDTDEPPPGDTPWRGSLQAKGDFTPSQGWTWGFDGTLVSDRTFMNRYGISNDDQATDRLYIANVNGKNYFSAEALYYQTLLTTEDQSQLPAALPFVQYSYLADAPVLGGEFGFDSSAYYLVRDKAGSPFAEIDHGTEQTRATTIAHWQRRTVTDIGAVLTPFARLRSDLYVTRDLPDPALIGQERQTETTARLSPTAGLDARFPLVASSDFGQGVLTPVAQIIWSEDEQNRADIGNEDAISLNFDHTSLFLSDRFTGLDRMEGGTRANAGLLYSLLMPDGGFLRVSAGESFHIAGINSFLGGTGLDGPKSDLVGAIAYQPNDHISFNYEARVEEDFSGINAQSAGLTLAFDLISGALSYANVDPDPTQGRPQRDEQVWGSASWNFTGAWSLNSSFRYDLESDKFLSKSLGIAFDCECMGASLTYSQTAGSDGDAAAGQSIFATVRFKSLGSASAGTGL